MNVAEETALIKTFERVRRTLLYDIQTAEIHIQNAKDQIFTIQDAARKREWWRLKRYLSAQDIETLSNDSPHDLLAPEED